MKHKIKLDEKSKRKNKETNKLGKLELFIFAFAVVIYFFYIKSLDKIINYPREVLYSTFFCSFSIILLIYFNKILSEFKNTSKDWLNNLLLISSYFIQIAIISWLFTGILLIPFNYYNIHVAKEGKTINKSVEIKKLVARARNNCIFFKYDGRMNVVYGHKPIMNDIYNKQDTNKYYLVLDMNEGLLGSYVLNKWDILLK